ncbi:hypothetical protein [Thalassobacillus sp. C254]|uniref:hypothetical protein n=1 Tax=Thalassobacillus sp. C254 TaxID=1225341 RepID=UPI0006CF5B55|nr:hypothetical protein [Thalassobacillus sp. C254]
MTEKKLTFGLDIDGTVTDPATFVPYLNKHFQVDITLEDITEYDLTSLLNVSQQEFWKWMKIHEKSIYSNAVLAHKVEQALLDWNKNHKMIYISARGHHLHEATLEWFNTHNLPYHHIELIGQHDKIESIKKHQVHLFFEDKHDNACNIAEECQMPVVLLDTPYNRKPVPANVQRVQNWQEAKLWVDNWTKNR